MHSSKKKGYAAKHGSAAHLDADLARHVGQAAQDRGIDCETAHGLAARLNQSPPAIGRAMDLLDLRIVRCQLGLFGYTPDKRIVTPAEKIAAEIEAQIRAALHDGRLPCAAAWALADRSGLSRLAVAQVCEALKIKISNCQLGAF
jgi:hypothetical protein